MSPQSADKSSYKRKAEEDMSHRHRGEGNGKMRADIGVMYLQAKEYQRLLVAT